MHISTSAVWWFTFEAQCIHFIVHNKINWQTKINLNLKFKSKNISNGKPRPTQDSTNDAVYQSISPKFQKCQLYICTYAVLQTLHLPSWLLLLLFSRPVVSDPLWPPGCPGLPVPHYLTKFAQLHVHCIGDAIQPPHPLMPFSPSAPNFSQHQGLFQWVGCLH